MKRKYQHFAHRIDVDAFEEAIGFNPITTDHKGNDIGHCFDLYGLHAHGDTTGKFAIHREKRVYNCWLCGGGNLLSLVMELKGMDTDEATHWLLQFADDQRDDDSFVDDFLADFQDVEERVETLPYFNPKVLERFDEKTDWFEDHGISQAAVDNFRLGYSSEVVRRPPPRGKFADDDEYVGPAVVFPHFWNERLVGWQQRWLEEDRPEWVPKYTNTGDFPKELTIFNYDNITFSSGLIYVVESAKTVCFLYSQGHTAVATFGDSINDPQLRLLRRISRGVVLCPDNDKAGEKWLRGCYNYLKNFIPVHALPPVEGEKADLSDLANKPGKLDEHLQLIYTMGVEYLNDA